MPLREMPGMVARAWPTPTSRASTSVALRSVLWPRRTRSQANSRKPVTTRAMPMNTMLSPRACTFLWMGKMANRGSVPTMISNIIRRAGGTGVGVVPWTMSPTPRKNSCTISTTSPQ